MSRGNITAEQMGSMPDDLVADGLVEFVESKLPFANAAFRKAVVAQVAKMVNDIRCGEQRGAGPREMT